ncbi:TetR family transcriptional regulator [bacterium AH-315-K03]|nr:TetR family transcriptional regulator [bacterium AH-315-K03]
MGRPSQPIISRENAAHAALEIIDESGLAALSLQKTADKLGVKAPSMYYHFKNKADLLQAVAADILHEATITKGHSKSDWKEKMVELTLATRRAILRHPNAASLLLEFYPRHIMLPKYNYWASQYEAKEEDKLIILEGLEALTYGSALLGSASRAKGLQPTPKVDKAEHPYLAKAITSNKRSEEARFKENVRRFLSAF